MVEQQTNDPESGSRQIARGLAPLTEVTVTILRPSTNDLTFVWTPSASDPGFTVSLQRPASWGLDLENIATLADGTYKS